MTRANEYDRWSKAFSGYVALLLVVCGLTFLSWMAAFFRDALLGDLVEFLAYTAWLATAFLFIYAIVRFGKSGSSIGARLTPFLGLDAIITACAAFVGACRCACRQRSSVGSTYAIRYRCGSRFGGEAAGTDFARAAFHVLVGGTNTIGAIIVAVTIWGAGKENIIVDIRSIST